MTRVILAESAHKRLQDVMSCHCDIRYRYAKIYVADTYWTQTVDACIEAVRHELIHVLLAPLDEVAKQIIDQFVLNDENKLSAETKKYVRDKYKDGMEQCVVDVTYMLGTPDNRRLTQQR